MAPVSSTPTATDAMLERKQILDENAVLKQNRDRMRDEHDLYAAALTMIREKFEAMVGREAPVEDILAMLKENFRQKKQDLTADIAVHESRLGSLKTDVASLAKTATDTQDTIDAKTGELAQIEARIADRKIIMAGDESRHTGLMVDLNVELAKTKEELAAAQALLDTTNKDHLEKTAWILKEEVRLSRRARDIAIYEGRILAAGKKVDPEFIMILE